MAQRKLKFFEILQFICERERFSQFDNNSKAVHSISDISYEAERNFYMLSIQMSTILLEENELSFYYS